MSPAGPFPTKEMHEQALARLSNLEVARTEGAESIVSARTLDGLVHAKTSYGTGIGTPLDSVATLTVSVSAGTLLDRVVLGVGEHADAAAVNVTLPGHNTTLVFAGLSPLPGPDGTTPLPAASGKLATYVLPRVPGTPERITLEAEVRQDSEGNVLGDQRPRIVVTGTGLLSMADFGPNGGLEVISAVSSTGAALPRKPYIGVLAGNQSRVYGRLGPDSMNIVREPNGEWPNGGGEVGDFEVVVPLQGAARLHLRADVGDKAGGAKDQYLSFAPRTVHSGESVPGGEFAILDNGEDAPKLIYARYDGSLWQSGELTLLRAAPSGESV